MNPSALAGSARPAGRVLAVDSQRGGRRTALGVRTGAALRRRGRRAGVAAAGAHRRSAASAARGGAARIPAVRAPARGVDVSTSPARLRLQVALYEKTGRGSTSTSSSAAAPLGLAHPAAGMQRTHSRAAGGQPARRAAPPAARRAAGHRHSHGGAHRPPPRKTMQWIALRWRNLRRRCPCRPCLRRGAWLVGLQFRRASPGSTRRCCSSFRLRRLWGGGWA